MKRLITNIVLLSLICFGGKCYAQNENTVLHDYLNAVRNVKTAYYVVQCIDTFTTGDVWNHEGKCILKKDTTDTLFGFHFLASRNDVQENDLYDGYRMFSIDDSAKTYSVLNKPGTWITGFPGGQMVVPDLMILDKNYASVRSYKENGVDVLRFDYKDDTSGNITDHYKLIYLDGATRLPVKMAVSLISLNKKQVQMYILSEVKINSPGVNDIDDKNYLNSYTLKVDEKKPAATLVGTEAPAFLLQSFTNKAVSLNDGKGKIVLLDFWETWCGPCVQSMSKVQALADKYAKKGLMIMGIMNEAKSRESAKLLVEKKGLTYTNLVGNGDIEKAYKITEVPKYFLIDAQGKIIYESTNGYEEKLEEILKEKFGF